MDFHKINTSLRGSFLQFSILIAMTLAGCGGGISGTGGGPMTEPGTTDTYQLRNLPDRISPEIPKTLLKGEELTPSQSEEPGTTEEANDFSPRAAEMELVQSRVWREFSGRLVDISITRANAQIHSTIVDVVFDEILNQCADQPTDCTIPAGQIKMQLTQDVTNRLKEIVVDLVESLPAEYLSDYILVDWREVLDEQFTSLVDSEVVFGQTRYSKLDGAPFDHSVRTRLNRKSVSDPTLSLLLWTEQDFYARWHENGHVAKFLLNNGQLTEEYFYQNDAPGELVVTRTTINDGPVYFEADVKVVANNPDSAGVLVEIAIPALYPDKRPQLSGGGDTSYPSVEHQKILVNMDNNGGYAIYDRIEFDVTDTPRTIAYIGARTSFNFTGKLIAEIFCDVSDFDEGVEVCEPDEFKAFDFGQAGAMITDSPYYFEAEDFDSLVAVHDAIQWRVQGLPSDINTAAVVSASSAIETSERELLCRGFRYFDEDMRTFCSATDEQLDNVDVLELIEGLPGAFIPSARLEPF